MTSRNNLILASSYLLALASTTTNTVTDAFSFSPTTVQLIRPSCTPCLTFSRTGCLYAADDESGETSSSSEESTDDQKLSTEDATDILNSPAFLRRKVDVLKSDLAAVEEKIAATNQVLEANKAEWGPQLEELQKEYVNIQDRMTKQNKEGGGTATLEVARSMLDALDNFDRAFGVVTPETDEEREVEAAYKEAKDAILETFASLGIREVETVGKEFDYEFHQAVMMRPDEEYEEGMVCEELAKGYIMEEEGKLIRAAMVVVAA